MLKGHNSRIEQLSDRYKFSLANQTFHSGVDQPCMYMAKSAFDSSSLNTPFIYVDSFIILLISPEQLCIAFYFSSHGCNNPSSSSLHPVYFYIPLKTVSSQNHIFYDSCRRQGLTSSFILERTKYEKQKYRLTKEK